MLSTLHAASELAGAADGLPIRLERRHFASAGAEEVRAEITGFDNQHLHPKPSDLLRKLVSMSARSV
jgi:hypothetical protein